jgi:methionyl-tRNA formyltransferase
LRVAFAGTPEFALPALAALTAHHTVVGVLTQPDRPRGRGRILAASAVKAAALRERLPLEQPQSLRTEAAQALLREWAPEVLVVVAYGLILPPQVLSLPRLGCLNIHASLLPRWRGAAPIQRAILAGDAYSGISIMQMDEGLDTGPLLLQRPLAISRAHTAGMLHDELAVLGAAALIESLAALAAGTARPAPQPSAGATYAAKIDKAEARIDWTREAPAIERQVRAFNPWPVAETRFAGEQLRILAARARPVSITASSAANVGLKADKSGKAGSIVEVLGDSFVVQCGSGALEVLQVQRAGRRATSARDFSNSVALTGQQLG